MPALRKEGADASISQRRYSLPSLPLARGVRPRGDPIGLPKRAALRIPKLITMLESKESLRLKPVLYGTMERRARHEAALQRNLAILKRHDLAALAKAIDKPAPPPMPPASSRLRSRRRPATSRTAELSFVTYCRSRDGQGGKASGDPRFSPIRIPALAPLERHCSHCSSKPKRCRRRVGVKRRRKSSGSMFRLTKRMTAWKRSGLEQHQAQQAGSGCPPSAGPERYHRPWVQAISAAPRNCLARRPIARFALVRRPSTSRLAQIWCSNRRLPWFHRSDAVRPASHSSDFNRSSKLCPIAKFALVHRRSTSCLAQLLVLRSKSAGHPAARPAVPTTI